MTLKHIIQSIAEPLHGYYKLSITRRDRHGREVSFYHSLPEARSEAKAARREGRVARISRWAHCDWEIVED